MEDFANMENEYRCNGSGFEPVDFEVTLLEPRPFRPFKSSEEYLYAMKEDLAEWLNGLYDGLNLTADNFLEQMETGVVLCKHANNVVRKAREYYRSLGAPGEMPIPDRDVVYRTDVLPETFHARDNVSNFISWCRALSIKECLLFETDDLVLRKNERSFILCLLEVARRGAKFGMPAPLLVQLEQEIDAELANDDGYQTTLDHHQAPQVVTNDLRSLHERVVELLSRCTCPSQFPMIRVADGKYRIGDTKVLIFVRILRSHVMVRVGGGWDTLEHYLDKHDPCRCRSGHRLATSAKLTMQQGKTNIPSMHVTYNRPPQPPTPTSSPMIHRRPLMQSASQSNILGRHQLHKADRLDPSPTRYHVVPPAANQCSDDSSTSNPSLHDSMDQQLQRKSKPASRKNSSTVGGSTSEDYSEDDDEHPSELGMVRSPTSRKRVPKRELMKGTVPSSWQYTPSIENQSPPSSLNGLKNNLVSRKATVPAITIPNGSPSTKLPSFANRAKSHSPPRVLKVSQRTQSHPPKWSDGKSQSSEDLYKDFPGSGDKRLIFYSRGTSPVNPKGRQNNFWCGGGPKDTPMFNFRRNDPIRHSSYHSKNYSKRSPPRPPPRPALSPDSKKISQGMNHRRIYSPDRQRSTSATTPSSPTYTSPILTKLMQHSQLCSDEDFLRKIELLIAEYESKSNDRDLVDENFNKDSGYRSLPNNIQDKIDLERKSPDFPARKSPKDATGRPPSKIPLPKWQ